MDDYLQSLATKIGGLEVRTLPGKGRCLFANKKFHKDEAICTETPIVSIQNVDNNHVFPACHHCCTPLGSLSDLIRPMLQPSLTPSQKAPLSESMIEELESEFCNEESDNATPSVFTNIDQVDAVLSPIVPCLWNCGALFCSEACRTEANLNYHLILCTGYDSSRGPFHDAESPCCSAGEHCDKNIVAGVCSDHTSHVHKCDSDCGDVPHHEDDAEIDVAKLYEKFCLSNNDYYIMLARFLFQTLRVWYENNNDMDRAMLPIKSLHSAPWWRLQGEGVDECIEEGKLLEVPDIFREFYKPEKEYTPDTLDFPVTPMQINVYESVEEARVILINLVKERLPKLVEYINHTNPLSTGSSSSTCCASSSRRDYLNDWEMYQLFSVESLSNFLGAIDLNNIEIRSYSPLVSYLDTFSDLEDVKVRDPALYATLKQIVVAQKQQRHLNKRVEKLHAKFMDDSSDDGDSGMESMEYSDEEYSDEKEGDDSDGDSDAYSEGSSGSDASIDVDNFDLDDIRELLPHMNGLAIMNVGRLMNHSCAPNVHTLYTHSDARGTIFALRDIEPGEEICTSYIDVDLDLHERRKLLSDYGFFCSCSKCTSKENAVQTK